jgi:hypothetical protein
VRANLIFSLALVCCASCGGGGSGPNSRVTEAVAPVVASSSPGGYWVGVDSDGYDVAMLADEEGEFYFVAGLLRLGTGVLTVTGQDGVDGVVTVPQDQILQNQSSSTDCKLEGTLVEYESMILDVRCKESAGQQVLTTFTLDYDPIYERDSSLETIAGLFDYAGNDVLNISADGMVFSQDGDTGCVTSGTVVATNSAFNAYKLEVQLGNCPGVRSELRGRTLQGLGMLDNSVFPEELLIVVSTTVDSPFLTLMRRAQRL